MAPRQALNNHMRMIVQVELVSLQYLWLGCNSYKIADPINPNTLNIRQIFILHDALGHLA